MRLVENTKASELLYYDGTGAQSIIGPLQPGLYKLVFWYSVAPDRRAEQKIGDTATWSGKTVTNEVPIQVIDVTTRGIVTGDEPLRAFTETIRMRESKPVTLNDAEFVVVAQADWKPEKHVKSLPIEIQLRIKNLGKSDLIFPTLDTFGVKISTASGTRIMPAGGRKGTIFTRPICLPPGVSYSFGAESAPYGSSRRAELRWTPKTDVSQLVYFDGTGTVNSFGPLETGRYRLAFWYDVSPRGAFKAARDSATWIGKTVTEDIIIDVDNP